MLLAESDIQEQLSVVYLKALASAAGFVFAEQNLDRTGTDLIVRGGLHGFPQIDWQIKATKNLGSEDNGYFSFPLKKRNYDLLIEPSGHPRLLMVYEMPRDRSQWLESDRNQLVMRKCAYWVSLSGLPQSENDVSVTIRVPSSQVLSVSELTRLMGLAKDGRI
ncbi:hypothetical protein C0V75_16515 [Tabrizicola sp. TH137]|uniref:DUF4365 domain-containing protein n=1 Tax=Tabrizicola sp. TH137 TaxID=2067452 RepID=UPI000C7B4FD3|nr:hypothetical protein C0V75_16515 [Tabrizicola sp. TH137]